MTPRFWLRWCARLVVAVVVGVVLLFGITAFRVWHVARQDAHPRSDVILVMGAAQYNGRPTEIFAARLDHALALFKLGVAPRILTVGGREVGDRTTEGAAGASYLRAHGVPAAALEPVGQGNDTYTSLQAAQRLMSAHHWTTAVIVTDPWHCLRSRTMARDLGIHAETSPVRSGPVVHTRATEFHYVWRETLAYLYYEIFGASHELKGPPAA